MRACVCLWASLISARIIIKTVAHSVALMLLWCRLWDSGFGSRFHSPFSAAGSTIAEPFIDFMPQLKALGTCEPTAAAPPTTTSHSHHSNRHARPHTLAESGTTYDMLVRRVTQRQINWKSNAPETLPRHSSSQVSGPAREPGWGANGAPVVAPVGDATRRRQRDATALMLQLL